IPMKSELTYNLKELIIFRKFQHIVQITKELQEQKIGYADLISLSSSREFINATLTAKFYDQNGTICKNYDEGFMNGSVYVYNETFSMVEDRTVSSCERNYKGEMFCENSEKLAAASVIILKEVVENCGERFSKKKRIIATTADQFSINGVRYKTPPSGVIILPKNSNVIINNCTLTKEHPIIHDTVKEGDKVRHHQLNRMNEKIAELEKKTDESWMDRFFKLLETLEGKLIVGAVAVTAGLIVITCAVAFILCLCKLR
uniref:Glycoprotein n=1 Tax=Panagrolaimus sp. ES5 TaxID=591445 RepID=A0AC34GDK0_9BILA